MIGFVALLGLRPGEEGEKPLSEEVQVWAREVAAELNDGTTPEQVVARVRAGNCPWDGKSCLLIRLMGASRTF